MEAGVNLVETTNIGLAAFMKMSGSILVKTDNKVFTFLGENGETIRDWDIKYANSCCRRHDSEVMYLKKLLS